MSDGARSSARTWIVPVLVVVVAIALLAVVLTSGSDESEEAAEGAGQTTTAEQQNGQNDLTQIERRDPDDPFALGDVDAPVTLIVFSDYQCPYCAKWSDQTLPLMMEHVDSGDLRIEWRDANIFGEASRRASAATYAAAMQDRFMDYHQALFVGGDKRLKHELTQDALVGLAGRMGMDEKRFVADMTSASAGEQLDRNEALARQLGVPSTPVFLIGGNPLVGAQPSQVFLDAFDEALERSRG